MNEQQYQPNQQAPQVPTQPHPAPTMPQAQPIVEPQVQPAAEIPVQPVVEPQPNMTVQEPQAIPAAEQVTSGDSITFDYNQLYANAGNNNIEQVAQVEEDVTASALQETPIVFEEEKTNEPTIVKNVVPTFDTRALEDNQDDMEVPSDEPLINTIRSESQQEKEQYKKNLLFIAIFFGILIIAVWFIFPLLAGY